MLGHREATPLEMRGRRRRPLLFPLMCKLQNVLNSVGSALAVSGKHNPANSEQIWIDNRLTLIARCIDCAVVADL